MILMANQALKPSSTTSGIPKTWHRNTVGAHAIDLALKDHVNSVHYMANTTIDCSQKIAEAAASLLLPSNPYPMTQYKY